jgi:hypothetical protein
MHNTGVAPDRIRAVPRGRTIAAPRARRRRFRAREILSDRRQRHRDGSGFLQGSVLSRGRTRTPGRGAAVRARGPLRMTGSCVCMRLILFQTDILPGTGSSRVTGTGLHSIGKEFPPEGIESRTGRGAKDLFCRG